MTERLPCVWEPTGGRFDDGIEEITEPPGHFGPYYLKLLRDNAHVEAEDKRKQICPKCGSKHDRCVPICFECSAKRRKELQDERKRKRKARQGKQQNQETPQRQSRRDGIPSWRS